MESMIFKLICANQGAEDTDFLVFNLGSSVSEIVRNSDKLVPCCPFGQPKVVARTRVRLCRNRDCPGSCRELHLCRSLLFTGFCHFSLTSGRCSFSHDLNSEHNKSILGEQDLDELSRKELCTLLLQSDDRLLPPICHDYNNGPGAFGQCHGGEGCRRVHICERFLYGDCRCPRNHTFRALQPLKALEGIPEHLLPSLKSAYANLQALRYHDDKVRRQGGDGQGETPNPEETSDGGEVGDGGRRRNRSRRRRGNGEDQSSHQEPEYTVHDLLKPFNIYN